MIVLGRHVLKRHFSNLRSLLQNKLAFDYVSGFFSEVVAAFVNVSFISSMVAIINRCA